MASTRARRPAGDARARAASGRQSHLTPAARCQKRQWPPAEQHPCAASLAPGSVVQPPRCHILRAAQRAARCCAWPRAGAAPKQAPFPRFARTQLRGTGPNRAARSAAVLTPNWRRVCDRDAVAVTLSATAAMQLHTRVQHNRLQTHGVHSGLACRSKTICCLGARPTKSATNGGVGRARRARRARRHARTMWSALAGCNFTMWADGRLDARRAPSSHTPPAVRMQSRSTTAPMRKVRFYLLILKSVLRLVQPVSLSPGRRRLDIAVLWHQLFEAAPVKVPKPETPQPPPPPPAEQCGMPGPRRSEARPISSISPARRAVGGCMQKGVGSPRA